MTASHTGLETKVYTNSVRFITDLCHNVVVHLKYLSLVDEIYELMATYLRTDNRKNNIGCLGNQPDCFSSVTFLQHACYVRIAGSES